MMWRWIAITLAIGTILTSVPALAHEDHDKVQARPAAAAVHPGTPGLITDMTAEMDHGDMEMAAPKPMPQRLYSWLGRWHPAVVHFPIALFLVTGILEAVALLGRRAWLTDGTRVLIGLAAVSALVAAGLGWLAMGLPGPTADLTHTLHRWIGTAIALLGLATWWAKERSFRPGAGQAARRLYAALLATIVTAVLVNAYLGGMLTHGANHLRF
ncbi:DUF2231 domain-containing protein [uncultured Brevundimonas sp.]|uniref:DUF2231 domain-containing protein n=1 Tax=uncultured Brevundimonas sp. TaxID=213418 RepID=UPI0030EBEDE9|tara:strand:+ start:2151 stop:2789 length:639 start_codon:yes stop_codon:yes gene_type:complete